MIIWGGFWGQWDFVNCLLRFLNFIVDRCKLGELNSKKEVFVWLKRIFFSSKFWNLQTLVLASQEVPECFHFTGIRVNLWRYWRESFEIGYVAGLLNEVKCAVKTLFDYVNEINFIKIEFLITEIKMETILLGSYTLILKLKIKTLFHSIAETFEDKLKNEFV